MAHFQYPLRKPTKPEAAAFAYPNEKGILKARLDKWSIDRGAQLTVKYPFTVGKYMIMQYEEYVVTDMKSDCEYILQSMRDPNVTINATAEEIDTHFYVSPGRELDVKNADSIKLLGTQERKPQKMESVEGSPKPTKMLYESDESMYQDDTDEDVELHRKTATKVVDDPDGKHVRYHSTNVVTMKDGNVTLNSGGWMTKTTKTRMNQASDKFDLGFVVFQKSKNWFVTLPDGSVVPYKDGMKFKGK